jgi:stringent starvation protein B
MITSSRPYLIRAIYEWLVDNQLTPYVMVDAMAPHVEVPQQYVEDGKIVLNIAPQAVRGLNMNNEEIEFDARFSGITKHIYVPIMAVGAIYAFENGRGMVFSDEDEDMPPPDGSGGDAKKSKPPKKGKPNLRVVK